jgi:hypothetical protein
MKSGLGATAEKGDERFVRRLGLALLGVIGCDLALVAVRAARYAAFFSQRGAVGYLLEPVVGLVVYAGVVALLAAIAARRAGVTQAVRLGTGGALIGGAIEVINQFAESVLVLPQGVVTAVTGAAMLGLFLLWGVVGFVGARRMRSFGRGLLAAVWSAVPAMLLTLAFGFLLVNVSLARLAHDEIGDPDYVRSGWTDTRAFAIANTFDAGFTHLLEAPVLALVFGAVGSAVGRVGVRRRAST